MDEHNGKLPLPLFSTNQSVDLIRELKDYWQVTRPDGTTKILGIAVLENVQVFHENKWYWIGVGALLGFSILFNVLFTLSLMYLNRKFFIILVKS